MRQAAGGEAPMIPGADKLEAELKCIGEAQLLETEQDMLDALNALPYSTMQSSPDFLRRTLAMLVLGQDTALETWCTQESMGVSSGDGMSSPTLSDDELRWMVHLLVYLEQLQQHEISSTPSNEARLLPSDLKPLAPFKNKVVLGYVRHLAAHPSLWRLLALYASLLSKEQVVDVFPPLLVPVEEAEERNYMVRAMQDCFKMAQQSEDDDGDMLVQQLLMQTVHLILLDDAKPFVTKAMAIGWLGILPHHASSGLICANQLCRQLLLGKKTLHVVEFLELYCPKMVLNYDDEADDNDEIDNFAAQRELQAIQTYLDASAAFDQWKNVMDNATALLEKEEQQHYGSAMSDKKRMLLSAQEQDMLASLDRRSKSQRVEGLSEQVGKAALEACMKLRSVLEFDGGWLVDQEDKEDDDDDDDGEGMETDDDGDDDDDIPMDKKRLEELDQLRRMYIPDVIFLMHNICDETCNYLEHTSSWMGKLMSSSSFKDTFYDTSSILSPGYWLHMGSTQLSISSATEPILNVLGQAEVRMLVGKLRDLSMRESDWKQDLLRHRGY